MPTPPEPRNVQPADVQSPTNTTLSNRPHIGQVLMTTDAVGGVWNYSVDLARGLSETGTHVVLAALGPAPRPHQRKAVANLKNVDLVESRYPLEWMQTSWMQIDAANEWLLDLERTIKPDVVHLNQYAYANLPWRAPRIVVAHSCVLSWMLAVKQETHPMAWGEYRARVQMGLHAADAVVAPSYTMVGFLRGIYGHHLSPVVIHNARPPDNFKPGKKETIILSIGRLWDEAKNATTLDLSCHDLSWPVLMIGDVQGPDGQGTKPRHAISLGSRPSDEVAFWLSRSAIFCSPARYEPFGLSVLEAALCRCALVLSDIPTFRELWDGAAVFVDPDDKADLASRLHELITNENLRESLSERAHTRAGAFNFVAWRDAYLDLYTKTVAMHKSHTHFKGSMS